jgi:hypothetical protein
MSFANSFSYSRQVLHREANVALLSERTEPAQRRRIGASTPRS